MLATNSAAKRIYFGESEAIVFFTAIALLVQLLTNGRYDCFHDELCLHRLWAPSRFWVRRSADTGDENKRQRFGSVEDLGQVVSSPWAITFERRNRIYLCRDLKISVRELWPRLKNWL
jgi:hypothetical protein